MEEQQILDNAYKFFLDLFNKKSESYGKKKVSTFKINPFTIQAAAKAISEDIDADSLSKAIVYPYALGTSIATTFGTKTQEFIVTALGDQVRGSGIQGMDIEYDDALDGRHKFCQLKAGPATINKDDIKTIEDHFQRLVNLGRTNHLNIGMEDRVVGVLYSTPDDLSGMYRRLNNHGIVVLAGKDLWYHLTGYEDLYGKLIQVAQEAAEHSSIKSNVDQLIAKVKKMLEENPDIYGSNE